jgi:protein-tyrosine phosphatase
MDIYWIPYDQHPRLSIVARPRGDDWLKDDLAYLKREGVDVLLSLLEPQEGIYLGLQYERDMARSVGLEFISYPIPDRTTPEDEDGFRRLVAQLLELIGQGKRIGVHCRGCIGRSTVVVASVLIQLGVRPADALALVEQARGCVVPDTEEQLNWILNFQPEPSRPNR